MLNTTMQRKKTKLNPYLVQKVMTASPEQLIVYIFDAGIVACSQSNKAKGLLAVQELINALNFEHKEVAGSFYQVYSYIMNQIREENFKEAKSQLSDLRQTWMEAFKLN